MPSSKLQRLEDVLKLVDGSVTKEEFVSAFKVVVDLVQKLKKTNEEEFALMHEALKKLTADVKNDTSYDVQEAKKMVERMAMDALKRVDAKLKAVKDGRTPVKGIDYDDGEDGEDGKTPTKEELVALIKPLIPKPIKGDKGDPGPSGNTVRVGWGAHPLTVQATGVAIDKNVRFLDFRGAGLTSVVRNANGVVVVTIGGGGAGSTVETPTGTVNASNIVFTPSAEPQYVVADGITYFAGAGYTWNGTTITMSNPPSQYIRAII